MKKFILSAVFVLFAPSALADKWIVLGDSLSAGYRVELENGWVALFENRLNEELGEEHVVVNAAVSGETTGGALARLPNLLEHHADADRIIIELGGNDGLQGHPISAMKQNLRQMISLSQEAGLDVYLVSIQIPTNYGPRYTRQFAAVYGQLDEEFDIHLIPFFLENVALNKDLMQDDGIHPNEAAQPILEENIWRSVAPTLGVSVDVSDDA